MTYYQPLDIHGDGAANLHYGGRALHPKQFNCKPGISTRAQMTTGLNALLAACADPDEHATAILDPDDYETDGPLSWPGMAPRIKGAGSSVTRILSAESALVALTVGDGSDSFGGYIGGFSLVSPSSTPAADGGTGLLLNGTRLCHIDDVAVGSTAGDGLGGFDIGFDMTGNCYLSRWTRVRALFAQCNVGLNLRSNAPAYTNGDDHEYAGCVFHGRHAAVWSSGTTAGHLFQGGQLAVASHGVVDSPVAAFVVGKDYLTGVESGSGRFRFVGTNFEGSRVAPLILAYANPRSCVFDGVFFLGQSSQTNAPARIFSALDRQAGRYEFNGCTVGRHFTAATLGLGAGTDDNRFVVDEFGWKNVETITLNAGNRTIAANTFSTMYLDQLISGATVTIRGRGNWTDNARWGEYVYRGGQIYGVGAPESSVYGMNGWRYHRSDSNVDGERTYIMKATVGSYVNAGWVGIQ